VFEVRNVASLVTFDCAVTADEPNGTLEAGRIEGAVAGTTLEFPPRAARFQAEPSTVAGVVGVVVVVVAFVGVKISTIWVSVPLVAR
jgi:hypothetical protein